MNYDLTGKKVAILVADGFEQVELTEPRAALDQAGAETVLISPVKADAVQGMNHDKHGKKFKIDLPLKRARADDYDALLLPGGVFNPDALRAEPRAVEFVREFFAARKPVAAICHGPQTLIEADVVRGRKLTSFPSVKTDLKNAGANWVDEKVVVDQGLVTSRKPADIPAFNRKMVEEFAEGVHPRSGRSKEARVAPSRPRPIASRRSRRMPALDERQAKAWAIIGAPNGIG